MKTKLWFNWRRPARPNEDGDLDIIVRSLEDVRDTLAVEVEAIERLASSVESSVEKLARSQVISGQSA